MEDKQKKDEIELKIEGMTCDSCATHVISALQKVDGVALVELPSWKSETARVIANPSVTEAELEDAVKNAGYKAKMETRILVAQKLVLPVTPKREGYDLVVIGTGGAGVSASIKAAELGYKVAIIEKGEIGGTCVNIGCVPSKTLIRAAEAYHNAGHNPFQGMTTTAGELEWRKVVLQKDSLIEGLRKEKYIDVLDAYKDNITLLKGHARLTIDGEVHLDDGTKIRPSRIIIATGARPRILAVEGSSETSMLTSTTLMDLEYFPKSLIVIGGRSIALELGQTFARFGTKVTILQRSKTIIPDHEPEIAKALTEYLRAEDIEIFTGIKILSIADTGEKVVKVEVDGKPREFRAEEILMAVGRSPNTDDMGLSEAGVELNEHGFIKVDSQMRTSNKSVFAAGDVTTLPKFVYVAAASGGIASENALKNTNNVIDLSTMPAIIFTSPQIATVGMTEIQAKETGHEVRVSALPLKYVPRALAARDVRGLIKLVADVESGQLLGTQVLAEDAGEIIQTAAMAIYSGKKYGFTVTDLQKMIFPYLVQVEGIKLAALAFDKDVSKLSCCAG
ncbi:MAG: mercury(II) reductase [Candidatus Thorarchaeota archaeon]